MSLKRSIAVGLSGLFLVATVTTMGVRAWATPGPDVVRVKAACKKRITSAAKTARCVACIKRGGHFHQAGKTKGLCHWAPNHGVIRKAKGCKTSITKPGKLKRCIQCVKKGGAFQKMGGKPGYCNKK